MRASFTTASETQGKVYYLATGWRFSLFGVGFVGIIFPVVFTILIPEIRSGSVPFFLFFWLLGGELLYEAWASRLVLTSEGIVYYQPRYTVTASWSDVEKININPPGISLILQKPSLRANFLMTKFLKLLGAWDRIIPLNPYMNKFVGSDLVINIHTYAPHLFQEEAQVLV